MRMAKYEVFQRLHLIWNSFLKTNAVLILHAYLLFNKPPAELALIRYYDFNIFYTESNIYFSQTTMDLDDMLKVCCVDW